MPTTTFRDPCVVPSVQPLLNELKQPVSIQVYDTHHQPGRAAVEQFIGQQFHEHYGAQLSAFYPTLLAFSTDQRLRAAVGMRDSLDGALFAEHYLSMPVEDLIAEHWQQTTQRSDVAEVGNLALAAAGEARWVIAAVTTFLHARGYRWVLFTAVPALFNAFRRLGLNPVRLAAADPECLPDGGREWGRYYDETPIVCVGDIHSGQRKLGGSVCSHQPMLRRLLADARARAGGSGWAMASGCER